MKISKDSILTGMAVTLDVLEEGDQKKIILTVFMQTRSQ